MPPPQRVDGVEEGEVTRGDQEEEHSGRAGVHSCNRKEDQKDAGEDETEAAENVCAAPPANSQEPKKEAQGVGHFLGMWLGSPMGRPFMCR